MSIIVIHGRSRPSSVGLFASREISHEIAQTCHESTLCGLRRWCFSWLGLTTWFRLDWCNCLVLLFLSLLRGSGWFPQLAWVILLIRLLHLRSKHLQCFSFGRFEVLSCRRFFTATPWSRCVFSIILADWFLCFFLLLDLFLCLSLSRWGCLRCAKR